jgi:hypothetical protein
MKNNKNYFLLLLLFSATIFGQDFIFKNQNKVMGSNNPSFYGFGDSSKAGVIYSSEGFDQSKIENKFGYANYFFEEKDFSIALEANLLQISTIGFSNSTANLHYIYKATLTNDWIFNPSVSVGYGNSKLDFSSLVFEDQINMFTGAIAGVSTDPISMNNSSNYLDIGAGFSLHNSTNLFLGLNFKHLNRPETSFNGIKSNIKDMFVSVQVGYEKELNPYGRGILPDYSYLFLYNTISKQGSKNRIDLYQEAILGDVSFGINEHFNSYEGFSVSQIGTSLGFFVEEIEFGVNYSIEIGNKAASTATYNTFEIYVVFDFNPFKKNKRGNNNRFYDM